MVESRNFSPLTSRSYSEMLQMNLLVSYVVIWSPPISKSLFMLRTYQF